MKRKFALLSVIIAGGVTHTSHIVADSDISDLSKNVAHFKVEIGRFFGYFAKNYADVEFEFATKNIYGVDGKPVTGLEKDELSAMEDYLKNHMAEIFAFQTLNCTYKFDEIEKKFNKKMHDNIGVIKVEYKVKCDEDLNGHNVQVNLKHFKNIQAIRYKIESTETARGYIEGPEGVIAIPR